MAANSTILNPSKYAYVHSNLVYGDTTSANGLFTPYDVFSSANRAFGGKAKRLTSLNDNSMDQVVKCVIENLLRSKFVSDSFPNYTNIWENCFTNNYGIVTDIPMGDLYIKFYHKDGVTCLDRDNPMPELKTPALRFFALASELNIATYPPPKLYDYYVRYFNAVHVSDSYRNFWTSTDRRSPYFGIPYTSEEANGFYPDPASSGGYLTLAYCLAKVACIYFKPKDGSPPFYYSLTFVSNKSDKFKEMWLDSGKIQEVKTFFPWLAIKDSKVISGTITDSSGSGDSTFVKGFHAAICLPKVPECGIALNTIGCCSDFPGLAKVSYGGDVFDFSEEWAICPKDGLANPIKLIVKLYNPRVSPIVVYGHFDLVNIYINVYAYNFRYIHHQSSSGFGLFSDESSVQSQTIKYENQSLAIGVFFNLNMEDSAGNPTFSNFRSFCPSSFLAELEFRFVASIDDPTVEGALIYPFLLPIIAKTPQLKKIERSGDLITITTDYVTKITYYFDHDPQKVDILINFTESGRDQQTGINISGKRGILFYTIRNYFSDFGKCFSVSGSFHIESKIILPTFKLELLKDGSAYSFYDSAGTSMTFIEINNCTQSSFDNYTVGSDYSYFNYGFKLTFTMDDPRSTMWANIRENDFIKIYSGNTILISNSELSANFFDSKTVKSLILLLNKVSPFEIPFTFYNYSNFAPVGNVVSQPVAILEYVDAYAPFINAYLKFSFNYQYAYKIEYEIQDQLGEIIHGPISKKTLYSTESVVIKITTDIFSIGKDWESLKAVIKIFNRVEEYPYEEVFTEIQTSDYTRSSFPLSTTTPAEIKFYSNYSDPVLSVTPTFTRHGDLVYAFLQLYDYNNNEINVADYALFLSDTVKPKFIIVESNDWNLDVPGVTLTKITDYIYSFKIQVGGVFNDLNLDLQVDYESIL